MKNLFTLIFAFLTAICASAQTPDIRIKTKIYEKDGPTNAFTLVLGAAPGKAGYADIVCSGGNQSEAEIITAYYNQEDSALVGTYVACQVDEQGIVEVFCDDGVVIDYLSCTGAEITSIEFKNPEDIAILALEHNMLEKFDLSPFTNIEALYLKDNPMTLEPFYNYGYKEKLLILELQQIENISPSFDIAWFPNLVSFDAMSTHGLSRISPEYCPNLKQLSIDNTSVSYLNVKQNPELLILNISETRIQSIDLSANTKLQQFYATHSSAFNPDIKLSEIDVTHNPDLFYLFLNDNDLTSLDVSKCPLLQDLYVRNNKLTTLDLTNNTNLLNVFISGNNMDFNTLPVAQETWLDYDLTQKPLAVPTSVLVGKSIDFTSRVMRSDSETFATLFTTNENEPEIFTEVDNTLYTFEDGKLTINTVLPDSVYASFYNSTFRGTTLNTTRFLVKDASSFGQPNLMATIKTPQLVGMEIKLHVGLANAIVGNQRTFLVDLGDGNLKEFIAISSTTPAEPNVVAKRLGNGDIRIFMYEGETLTALKIEDLKLNALDLSNAMMLKELALTNTQLTNLDLQWNRLLERIDITGNNFGNRFSLAGANGGYGKNLLYHINLSNNNMTEVKLNEPGSWQHIDLSHNKLSNVNFTDADNVKYLDVSHNDFEYLKINYLGQLRTFYCNDNKLSELVLPETNVIETFNCANNCFTFANIPTRNGLDEEHFTYAPQAVIEIPTKGPGYNLSSQNVTFSGKSTVFTWETTDGETLVNGTDYTCQNGITRFNDNTIGKTLYCEITNDAYPAFSGDNVLRTTAMLSAGMPTHLLGTFTTPAGGQEVRVALTSAVPNNSLYIDWTGTNSLEQYPLKTDYTVFTAKTTAGANVKVWSYDENDNITVFSLTNARLADVDLSPMTHLTTLTLSNSGISTMKWPESPKLRELTLNGCTFTSFDFNRYPELYFVDFDNNKFTSLDLSGLSKLGTAGFARNNIKNVKLSGNTNLWQLSLVGNQIETIDLSGAPNVEQLFLSENKLSAIDLTPLKHLNVVYLDANKFDFSNLPVPQEQWMLYTYGNQPELKVTPVDGVVDLSSQAERDGVKTVYNWFYGAPTIDTVTGEISGEMLIEDDEYRIENGVTTFLSDLDKVCCVLTNELFPKTYLITNIFSVEGSSNAIETIVSGKTTLGITANGRSITVNGATDGATITLLTPDGRIVATATAVNGTATLTAPSSGMHIVTTKGAAAKVAVR